MAGIHYLEIPKNCPGCGEVWMEHSEGGEFYRFAHSKDCPILPWLDFLFQAYWIPTMGSTTEPNPEGGPPIPLPPVSGLFAGDAGALHTPGSPRPLLDGKDNSADSMMGEDAPTMPTDPVPPQRIDKGPMPGEDAPRREPIQRFQEGEKVLWLACGARQCGNMFVHGENDPRKPVCRCGNDGLFFKASTGLKTGERYDGT